MYEKFIKTTMGFTIMPPRPLQEPKTFKEFSTWRDNLVQDAINKQMLYGSKIRKVALNRKIQAQFERSFTKNGLKKDKLNQTSVASILISDDNQISNNIDTPSVSSDIARHNDNLNKGVSEFNKLMRNRIKSLKGIFDTVFKMKIGSLPQNEATQTMIEKSCMRKHEMYNANKLQPGVLHPDLAKYWDDHEKDIREAINTYIAFLASGTIRNRNVVKYRTLMKQIIETLNPKELMEGLMYSFLYILSNESLEHAQTSNGALILSKQLGKNLVEKYLRVLCKAYAIHIRSYKRLSDNLWYEFIEDFKRKEPYHELFLDKRKRDDLFIQLGGTLLEILEAQDLIHRKTIRLDSELSASIFQIKNEELLKHSKGRVLIAPQKLPMICKPRDWQRNSKGNGFKGGYISNGVFYESSLLRDKISMRENSSIFLQNKVFSMVNGIGATGFKVNEELLFFLISNNKYLLDPEDRHPLESKSKLTKKEKSLVASHYSKIHLQEMILEIAMAYSQVPYLYFPLRIDQRGRLYCMTDWFHYQGSELAKALIMFSEPGIIKRDDEVAIKYLKVNGANMFGLDKKSDSQKLAWLEENEKAILDYVNNDIALGAKNKYLFLAFCIEYTRFHKFMQNENQREFKTYLPIQLDATTNGFQHMAMLSNQFDVFEKVNLIISSNNPNKDDRTPSDFYTFMVQRINKHVADKLTEGKLESSKIESYMRLNEFQFDRNILKHAIMTIVYNASSRSMNEYIKEQLFQESEWDKENRVMWYTDGKDLRYKVNDKDIGNLVQIMKHIVHHDFIQFERLSKYLSAVANVFTKLNLNITWYPGNGMEVVQSYLLSNKKATTPWINSKSKVILKYHTDNLDLRKQTRALMPNLIHSLDATSLCLLYDAFIKSYDNPQFYCVHDCFATTADKTESLKTLLASVYTNLYLDNTYLLQFDKNLFDKLDKANIKYKNRTITMDGKGNKIELYPIDWVLDLKKISESKLQKIESQFILI